MKFKENVAYIVTNETIIAFITDAAKEGYRWTASGRPTEFVPITRIPDAKLIITKPKITSNSSVKILAYATGREKMKEKYKDSHKYVSGSEYLEYRERKVIL